MSGIVRKPAFCIAENKDAADQRLCFRYIDRAIPLLMGLFLRGSVNNFVN